MSVILNRYLYTVDNMLSVFKTLSHLMTIIRRSTDLDSSYLNIFSELPSCTKKFPGAHIYKRHARTAFVSRSIGRLAGYLLDATHCHSITTT